MITSNPMRNELNDRVDYDRIKFAIDSLAQVQRNIDRATILLENGNGVAALNILRSLQTPGLRSDDALEHTSQGGGRE